MASVQTPGRGTHWFLLCVVYYVVAAASFNGYFTKWQFRDNEPNLRLAAILDGNADQPFVYRQLLPMIANGVERAMPDNVRKRATSLLFDDDPAHLSIARFYPNATDARNPQYALRYYMIFGMSFASLLFSMFVMRAACSALQADVVAATLAPIALALVYPVILTVGAYFYDFPELLFLSLAVWLAVSGRAFWLIILTLFATLNKESFLFFTLTLFPFLRISFSLRATVMLHVALLAVAISVNVIIKMRFSQNGGTMVQFHIIEHLKAVSELASYLRFERNYGVPMTKGFNVITLLFLALFLRSGWKGLSVNVKRHSIIALSVNMPLFIFFASINEIRNLSMLAISVLMITCANISRWISQPGAQGAVPLNDAATSIPSDATSDSRA